MRQLLWPEWPRPKPLIGMVHLLPLPGAPRWEGSRQAVLDAAAADVEALAAGGADAILYENFGDTPFYPAAVPAETVAAMTAVITTTHRLAQVPFGVNVLRNDAAAALGIAAATGAAFVRVNVHTGALLTDQGWIAGRAHDTLRLRRQLGLRTAICADVFVKHAAPPAGISLEEAARDSWERGHADALIVSGAATGAPTRAADVERIRAALPAGILLVGSGLDHQNAETLLRHADGAIVGSAIKTDGRAQSRVSRERVRMLADIFERLRGSAR